MTAEEAKAAIDACYGLVAELEWAVAFMQLAVIRFDRDGPWELDGGPDGPEFDDGSTRRLIERASEAVRAFRKAAPRAL
jgi:hypothetical protein